jgi:hypothetical protein
LTIIECDRAIRRAITVKRVEPRAAFDLLARLENLARTTEVLELTPSVATSVLRDFPIEPVRALDAIHLASALVLRDVRDVRTVASCDQRVRENAAALGFTIVPA